MVREVRTRSHKTHLQIIADFLVYLLDDRKLSSSAIKGYSSMLSSVFSGNYLIALYERAGVRDWRISF